MDDSINIHIKSTHDKDNSQMVPIKLLTHNIDSKKKDPTANTKFRLNLNPMHRLRCVII
jgi:hypothetical protein